MLPVAKNSLFVLKRPQKANNSGVFSPFYKKEAEDLCSVIACYF
jgi:hypothetical protein